MWLSLAEIVNGPVGAGCSTMFLAVLAVWYRSPAWAASATVPLVTRSVAASRRITLHGAASSLPLKLSRRTPGVHCACTTVTRTVELALPPWPSETVTVAL